MSEIQKNPDDQLLVTLSVADLREVIAQEIKAALDSASAGPDGYMDAGAVAAFLSYSKDWVYKNWKVLGGKKFGRKGLRFSRRELQKWAQRRG